MLYFGVGFDADFVGVHRTPAPGVLVELLLFLALSSSVVRRFFGERLRRERRLRVVTVYPCGRTYVRARFCHAAASEGSAYDHALRVVERPGPVAQPS